MCVVHPCRGLDAQRCVVGTITKLRNDTYDDPLSQAPASSWKNVQSINPHLLLLPHFVTMGKPRSKPHNTLLQSRMQLAKLVASRVLLGAISKYDNQHEPNIKSARQSGCFLRRRNKMCATYVLGVTRVTANIRLAAAAATKCSFANVSHDHSARKTPP